MIRKNIKLIFGLFICLLSLASCDKDGDYNPHTEFFKYSFSFFYPNVSIGDYEYIFQGKTTKQGGTTSRDTPEGLLEVKEVSSGKIVFSQQVSMEKQLKYEFVIAAGNEVMLYSPEKFISFTPTVIFSDAATPYTLSFGGRELEQGKLNYLPVEESTGTFEIRKEGSSEALFAQEMTLADGANVNLMQMSAEEFMEIPEDTEPEPTEPYKCKVRFYYPANAAEALRGAEEIRIDLYRADVNSWDYTSELPVESSLTVKKGGFSDYAELDFHLDDPSQYIDYLYSLTNTATNEKIVNYLIDQFSVGYTSETPYDGMGSVIFKKVTYQITDRESTDVMEGLTVRREQE